MTRQIVAGVNSRAESRDAARWAADEAALRRLPLCLVYAWEWLFPAPGSEADPEMSARSPARLLEAAAAEAAARHPALDISTRQIERRPAEALLSLQDEAETLVLGSRALGRLRGFVSGSVGLAVTARAAQPVVHVRPALPPPRGDVVVGIDLSEDNDALLSFAVDAAERRGTRLRAVHVWRVPPPAAGDGVDSTGNHLAAVIRLMRPWRDKHPDLTIEEEAVRGHPASELIASAEGTALLLVGRRAHDHALAPRIGHVTHAVLHHAPCPVAVVPRA
jgi:nucleotide-binding universal stress UspA family protein